MDLGISDKTAVVTGGGGRIGSADCEILADEGADVYCLDVDLEGAESVAADLDDLAGSVEPVKCDLTDREGWNDLTAVREGRAYALDGHQFVNRPGPRLVDSLEHLAGIVHPELFDSPPAEAARPLRTLQGEPTVEP